MSTHIAEFWHNAGTGRYINVDGWQLTEEWISDMSVQSPPSKKLHIKSSHSAVRGQRRYSLPAPTASSSDATPHVSMYITSRFVPGSCQVVSARSPARRSPPATSGQISSWCCLYAASLSGLTSTVKHQRRIAVARGAGSGASRALIDTKRAGMLGS